MGVVPGLGPRDPCAASVGGRRRPTQPVERRAQPPPYRFAVTSLWVVPVASRLRKWRGAPRSRCATRPVERLRAIIARFVAVSNVAPQAGIESTRIKLCRLSRRTAHETGPPRACRAGRSPMSRRGWLRLDKARPSHGALVEGIAVDALTRVPLDDPLPAMTTLAAASANCGRCRRTPFGLRGVRT
jgi:hypothetical protein